ncbi:MAG: hypothetical protein CR993_09285 [Rhodobacterales bacterium]|nr:MAG: hypothetical protein CR993_09285 [Rhodobacterales bacterium]
MGKVVGYGVGGILIVLGVLALIGAVELVVADAGLEAIAQGFLVPISLFVVGGFLIYMMQEERNK